MTSAPRSEITTAIHLLILKRSFSTKIANNIANTGFKNVIATASDAGMYITPLNKIATPAQPHIDLVICIGKLGLLNLIFLKMMVMFFLYMKIDPSIGMLGILIFIIKNHFLKQRL